MTVMRFLAAIFTLVAVIAFVVDLTPALMGKSSFEPRSIMEMWQAIAPKTLASARESVAQNVSSGVWSLLETTIMAIPGFAGFAGLAALCGFIGRRRRRVQIFVN